MANYRQSGYPGLPTVVKYLIIINVAVWLTEILWSGDWFINYFALHDIRSSLFKPHQFITHLFLHEARDQRGGVVFAHIGLNMFALWMFGSTLENHWGPKRFLNFYLICGVGAGIIYSAVMYFQNNHIIDQNLYQTFGDENAVALLKAHVYDNSIIGASGAIFGVLVAFGYTFPNTEMFIIPIPFPIKAKWLVIGYVLIELYSGFQMRAGDNVAHFAHLGGALVGFVLVWIWNRTNRKDFY